MVIRRMLGVCVGFINEFTPPKGQKQMLGERLYSAIQGMPAPPPGMVNNIGKITGMLLELDNSKVLEIIESSQDLREKVM